MPSFEKRASYPSWEKQNSDFSPGLISPEMSLQLCSNGVRFSVLMVQFQGFPRLRCRVQVKRGDFALPEKALKHHRSDSHLGW